MARIREDEIIFIAGMRGYGKSYLAKKWFIPNCKKPVFVYDSTGEWAREFKNHPNVHIYQPFNPDKKDFEQWCKVIWEQDIPCLAVVEEASNGMPSRMTFSKFPYINKMITQGRHRGIGMLIISQRPSDVVSKALSQSQRVYCFRLFAPCDVDALRKYIGSEWVKEIQTLPRYWFLKYSPTGVQKCPPIRA